MWSGTSNCKELWEAVLDNVLNTLGINSRLHWIPQAGREAFLVLNHNMRDIDGQRTFRSDSAELTAKINYTFRF